MEVCVVCGCFCLDNERSGVNGKMGLRRGSKWWWCSVYVIVIGWKCLDWKISMLVLLVVSK